MSNSKIENLKAQIETVQRGYNADLAKVREELQVEYNKVFEKDKALQESIKKCESSNEYGADDGGIYAWQRLSVDGFDVQEVSEYLETYLQETHCLSLDTQYEALKRYEGEYLIIQDDTRHDNGVWFNHKLIISESEYKDDGEVNETKRNELIEAWMEKQGYFPGVFRVDYHGNVFSVNTNNNRK